MHKHLLHQVVSIGVLRNKFPVNQPGSQRWKLEIQKNPHPKVMVSTLPETNIFAPENGWSEYDPFLLGFGLFLGANC